MELHEALAQIAEIRQQMARTEVFRGYRAVPVAFSGLLAIGAALYQSWWIRDPIADLPKYLTLWVGAAVLSAVAAGLGMAWRARHAPPSSWSREVTRGAGRRAVPRPSVVAGGLVTIALVRTAQECLWMLPGLWSILVALGIFASRRLLPRATTAVAVFYLMAGLACLEFARGPHALSAWAMGIPFGVGQLLAAAVLYGTLERQDGHQEAH